MVVVAAARRQSSKHRQGRFEKGHELSGWKCQNLGGTGNGIKSPQIRALLVLKIVLLFLLTYYDKAERKHKNGSGAVSLTLR